MVNVSGFDFSGWAATNNVECTDHTIIRPGAFKHNDGDQVSLVWQHNHKSLDNVLGYAVLEDRGDVGTYMYGFLNKDTEEGRGAKARIEHGDIRAISIYANGLKRRGNEILHGNIKEVSLVLAPADPGAYIDYIAHSDDDNSDSAVIYLSTGIELAHSDAAPEEEEMEKELDTQEVELEHSEEESEENIFGNLSDEQIEFVKTLVGKAYMKGTEDASVNHSDEEVEEDEGEDEMKHDIFAPNNEEVKTGNAISHEAAAAIIGDAKRYGSMKESFIQHADDYGIKQIDWLFPDPKNLNTTPEFIKRDTDWVSLVMNGVHRSPWPRIKSVFADITEDEARARGYLKGKLKKEEVFGLLKRQTEPSTVFKKQKIDRDDKIDASDFDAVGWIKSEMRMMLDEELAGAFLFGDGRSAMSEDKINESSIRPIATEADLFTIKYALAPDSAIPAGATEIEDTAEYYAKGFIKAAIKARKKYKGSGSPVMFTSASMLSEMLLLEDTIGHPLYKTEQELATKMRVSKIVEIPDEILARGSYNGKAILGLEVNLNDYYVGADKGGSINLFEDFDIDYNQMKYLIETRCSGAMVKPFSAICIYADESTGRTSKVVGDSGFKAEELI